MKLLARNARIYVIGCTLLGAVVLILNAPRVHPQNPTLFTIYLVAAVAVSLLDLGLPMSRGVLPAGLLLVLLGILDLSLPEVLVLGCAATVLRDLRVAKFRLRFGDLIFRMGSVAISIAAAYNAYHISSKFRGNPLFPALVLASSMVFFFHYVLASAITRDEQTPLKAFYRSRMFWLLPWFVAAGYLTYMINQTSQHTGLPAAVLALPMLFVVERGYRFYLHGKEKDQQHQEEMESAHMRTIEVLAVAIEAKDQVTHMHLRRVQVCAMEIGKEMGLVGSELRALEAAALLHDVGKLAIPEHIISKPGRLTPDEFEKMKIHPIVGSEILERMKLPYPVVPIVRAHHEKWDGTGYPAGLAGVEIPLGARILSAVDCLDAMASDRPYRRAMRLDEAMQKIVEESGKSFDPKVVEVLQRRYVELDRMAHDQVRESDRSWMSARGRGMRIGHGLAPATGLENLAAAVDAHGANLSAPLPDDFLDSIASARQEDQLLRELTGDVGNTLSLEETLSAAARYAGRIVPCDTIVISVCRGDKLAPLYINGRNSDVFSSGEFPSGAGLSGWVAENQKPIVNGNASVEPHYIGEADSFGALRSALSVPLQGHAGLIGVLSLYSPLRDAFTREHLRILQSVTGKLGLSIEHALRYHTAESSATTDYLTALPNARSLFVHLEQELARAGRDGSNVAVMVCDLDGFKQVNDQFGHLKGNEVLRLVADGLRATSRASDYIARLGGDEFVIVMPGLNTDTFTAETSRFREVPGEASIQACSQSLLSMSVGVAIFPQDGATAEDLLAQADRRMYESKNERSRPRSTEKAIAAGGQGSIRNAE
jgi:diguanylate cyclase (GGDEF)-like protein/putative nucleotidyltransferase with HDIG domain